MIYSATVQRLAMYSDDTDSTRCFEKCFLPLAIEWQAAKCCPCQRLDCRKICFSPNLTFDDVFNHILRSIKAERMLN